MIPEGSDPSVEIRLHFLPLQRKKTDESMRYSPHRATVLWTVAFNGSNLNTNKNEETAQTVSSFLATVDNNDTVSQGFKRFH